MVLRTNRNRVRRRAATVGAGLGAACVLGACVLVPGCVLGGESPGPVVTPPQGAVVASPFSPAGVRLLPLSHFEMTEAGDTRVLVFFELLDQWGDTVKGAGSLELRVSGADAAVEQRVEWAIDLADLRRNAALYDPSTRAYRLALHDLPGWLDAVGGGEGGSVELEAYFRTVGSDGRPAVLRDRLAIRGAR